MVRIIFDMKKEEKLLKIDNVLFKVNNLERSSNFYQQEFGLKKLWEDKKNKMVGFVFPKNDSEIVIHNNKNLPKFDFSFLVKNVNDFVNHFLKKGFKIFQKPINVRCGKYAVLLDLDHNKIPIIDLTSFNNKPKYLK